jgi:hypothetical protein
VTTWKEISRYTGLGGTTLIRAAKRGEVPVNKIGGNGGYVTVKKADLNDWREARKAFGTQVGHHE